MNGKDLEDALNGVEGGLRQIANAITAGAGPGTDDTGGTVWSLTEAAMGITAGLVRVAESNGEIAAALRDLPGAAEGEVDG